MSVLRDAWTIDHILSISYDLQIKHMKKKYLLAVLHIDWFGITVNSNNNLESYEWIAVLSSEFHYSIWELHNQQWVVSSD